MRAGFTLPEVLIVSVISVLIGGLLLAILVSNTGLFYRESAKVTQGLGVNDSLSTIRKSLREASTVAVGYPEVSPTYPSDATHLVLKLPSLDSQGSIISDTYDFVVYYKDEGNLRFKVFPNVSPQSFRSSKDQILAFNLDNLLFEYFDETGASVAPTGSTKVKVTVALKQQVGFGLQTISSTSEVELRND